MAKSNVERNREADARKREKGLTRVCVWVPEAERVKLQDFGRLLTGQNTKKEFLPDAGLGALAAFRYALTRETYIVQAVCVFLLELFDLGIISDNDLELFERDLNEAREKGLISKMDDVTWSNFVKSANKRIDRYFNICQKYS